MGEGRNAGERGLAIVRAEKAEEQEEVEEKAEHIPSREEILGILERVGVRLDEYKVTSPDRCRSDALGIYFWELVKPGEEPGDTDEFTYVREGNHPGGPDSTITTIMHMTYEGFVPQGGGEAVADLVDGEWKILI